MPKKTLLSHPSFILLLCIFFTFCQSHMPMSLTICRSISPSLSFQQFLQYLPPLSFNVTSFSQINYNMISLSGFTESTLYSSIDNKVSPLILWKNLYEIVSGGRAVPEGASSLQLRKHILKKYKGNSTKLLMHVDLNTISNTNAASLGYQIVNALKDLQLQGVTIAFNDFNSVKDGTASDWLQTLIFTIALGQIQGNVIGLIIPPTFIQNMEFFTKEQVNILIDFYVLKYYDTMKQDYLSYTSLFESSQYYPETSIIQLMKKPIKLDLCRTLIAKPPDSKISSQFIDKSVLNSAFVQGYKKIGWFGGYANLNYESDANGDYANGVLTGIRDICVVNGGCRC